MMLKGITKQRKKCSSGGTTFIEQCRIYYKQVKIIVSECRKRNERTKPTDINQINNTTKTFKDDQKCRQIVTYDWKERDRDRQREGERENKLNCQKKNVNEHVMHVNAMC